MANYTGSLVPPQGGGIASMLGFKPNPVLDYIGGNRNTLLGLAAGLVGGPTWGQGLSSGFQMAAQGGQMDQQKAEKLKAEAKVAQQTSTTRDLFAKNAPDLVPLLDSGAPINELFNEYMKRQQPGYGQEAPQNPYMSAGDGKFFNWQTGEYVNDPNAAPDMPSAPSGYQWSADGKLAFIPGGPADPAMAANKPPTDADVRSAKLSGVIQGDKALLLGPNGIYDKLADPWSQAVGAEVGVGGVGVGRPGMAFTSADYQSATNALTNIAQSYLYAISGQAAPAGEVAKIIESVTPKFGENATSVNNKKARLASYIAAIEASKYDVPTGGGGGADPEVENILQQYGVQ